MQADARAPGRVRLALRRWLAERHWPEDESDDLVLAVSEAVTNSVLHGGGSGEIALWHDGSRLLCEIRDRGRITDPLAGRVRPRTDQLGARGLWLIHQLCDLVQLRTVGDGQVVRLHITG